VNSIGREAFAECKYLTEVYILNPNTIFEDDETDLASDIFKDGAVDAEGAKSLTIYGKEGSTAKAYADRYKYKFLPLTSAPTFTVTIDPGAKEWVSFVSSSGNGNGTFTAKPGDEIKLKVIRTKQVTEGENTVVDKILGIVRGRTQVEGNMFNIYTVDTEQLSVDDNNNIDVSALKDPVVVSFTMPANNVTIETELMPSPGTGEQSLMTSSEITIPTTGNPTDDNPTDDPDDPIDPPGGQGGSSSTGGSVNNVQGGSLDGNTTTQTTGGDTNSSNTGSDTNSGNTSSDTNSGNTSGDTNSGNTGSGSTSGDTGSSSTSGGSSAPAPNVPSTPSSPGVSDGPSI